MKKCVLAAAVAVSLSALAPAWPVLAQETASHTVQQGDTLWDLSGGYLDDPLLWPRIWKLNPGIANPHRIYPGQVVRIPGPDASRVRIAPPQAEKEIAPGPDLDLLARQRGLVGQPLALRTPAQEEAAVQVKTAGEVMEMARQYDRGIGMVVREIPGAGRVLGTEKGWRRAAGGEAVLVSAPGAEPGRQFGVYRDLGRIPPRTFLGESPGHLLADIAIVEMISGDGPEQRAVVRRSFAELQDGDLLGPVPEPPVAAASPSRDGEAVSGTVLAVHQGRQVAGPGDIVYLDQGSSQGLVPGLRLSVKSADAADTTRPAGEIMILRVSADRAAALVTGKSNHDVRPGDRVGSGL